MRVLTEREIDWLALEGCDIIGFRPGSVVDYDLAGYDRVPRREVAPGSFVTQGAPEPTERPTPTPAKFEDRPYLIRVAGFRRQDLFGPDQAGKTFASLNIAWNDGLGNGLIESLLIDRKYGLAHSLEAPALGFKLPFFEMEWPAFRDSYPKYVTHMATRFEEMEPIYGGPLARRERGLCVLWCRDAPLPLFANAYARNAKTVGEELIQAIGRDAPPINPVTSQDRATLAKFWTFLRTKHVRILEFQAEIVRAILGAGTKIVGNAHELPPVDLEGFGRVYDYPGLAVRPLLVADEVLLRHYVAYFTQLFRDLSGKAPMVSVRVNLSAAGCRFIPSESLIRVWYDQAVRHGAGGFYLWVRDYPSDVARDPYNGPIPGNPDPTTLPETRWEIPLGILGRLATHRQFCVPSAQVAILVPVDAALLHRSEWRRIYTAFSACAEARIHTRFISDHHIIRAGVPPEIRLILAPTLEFVSPKLRATIERFTQAGGALLVTDRNCWDSNGVPAPPITGAQDVSAELFDVFPLGELASQEALTRSAEWIREKFEQYQIDDLSWVFDVSCGNLPLRRGSELRAADPGVKFEHWLYEHGSDWIPSDLASDNEQSFDLNS
jgi:hypothetical protein